ncbi:hypothetical protein C2E23DRAFT_872201 [Lenzites betulinus]|nr:hypothetical protein C2E23DRAFT_872201 [Lenzites betulinus]
MDTAVASLLGRLPASDAEYDSYALHARIYSYLEHDVLPAAPSDACPPLPVVAYAINNILHIQPPALHLIPSLLRLLVHVEVIRAHAIQKLRDLLQSPSLADKLHKSQRDSLELLVKPSRLLPARQSPPTSRSSTLIRTDVSQHIHYLWRTFDAEKDPPLTAILIDYFPAFFQAENDPAIRAQCTAALKERPWHHDITDVELEENQRVGAQAVQFMVDAARYADDPEAYCSAHSVFDDIFPPPDFTQIAAVVARFSSRVHAVRHTLEQCSA